MNETYACWNRLVSLGEPICIKLKQIYFAETPWAECYRKVGDHYTALKKIARAFYKGKDDESILRELQKYSNESLKAFMQPEDNPL